MAELNSGQAMLTAHDERYQGASRGAMIFLHGSGHSGPGCEGWINYAMPEFLPRLRSAGIIVVFPSAPVRAYTLKGGAPSAVWFDRQALALDASEDTHGIAATELLIRQLVQDLQAEHSTLSNQRIVLGGFSMGGATALTTGLSAWLDGNTTSMGASETAGILTSPPVNKLLPSLAGLAGIFSFSSWISTQSSFWPKLEAARLRRLDAISSSTSSGDNSVSSGSDISSSSGSDTTTSSSVPPLLPPVFLGHGSADALIPYAWGVDTHARLLSQHMKSDGANGEPDENTVLWVLEPDVEHKPGPRMLAELLEWTLRALPPI